MDLHDHTGPDSVLFCQYGKSAPKAICSCTPDEDSDAHFAAARAAEITKANASGAPAPQFQIVPGKRAKKAKANS